MVRNVASMSSGPCERLKLGAPPSGWFCGRLKDSGIGAWRGPSAAVGRVPHVQVRLLHTSGKSTQKAFMFMP